MNFAVLPTVVRESVKAGFSTELLNLCIEYPRQYSLVERATMVMPYHISHQYHAAAVHPARVTQLASHAGSGVA